MLVFLVRRTLDVETAVELTAETFAIALGSWARVRDLGAEQAQAWLFAVARTCGGRGWSGEWLSGWVFGCRWFITTTWR